MDIHKIVETAFEQVESEEERYKELREAGFSGDEARQRIHGVKTC